jgi:predicted XRE-type DNA-binding protein
MGKQIEVEQGSGNVFADIGLPNPEERLAKADLAIRISETIRARRLTQTRAAHILKSINPKSPASYGASFPVSQRSALCTF